MTMPVKATVPKQTFIAQMGKAPLTTDRQLMNGSTVPGTIPRSPTLSEPGAAAAWEVLERPGGGVEWRFSKRRLDTAVDVSLYQGGNCVASGTIRNVALHGVFIKTDVPFAEDSSVQIRLPSLDQKHAYYRLWGRVVHNANNGIGLHADILHRETCAAMTALLNGAEKG
jgi:hypothetical protein